MHFEKTSIFDFLCMKNIYCYTVCAGTFAVISIMIGSVTEKLAPDTNFPLSNGTNVSESVDIDERDAYRVKIACSLTLLAGIFQVCFSY